MTALPPGRTIQELNRNPNSEQLLGLTEAQTGQAFQQQEQHYLLNATASAAQRQADMLVMAKKAEIIGNSERGAPAMTAIASAVMQTGVDPLEIIPDWIGKRR